MSLVFEALRSAAQTEQTETATIRSLQSSALPHGEQSKGSGTGLARGQTVLVTVALGACLLVLTWQSLQRSPAQQALPAKYPTSISEVPVALNSERQPKPDVSKPKNGVSPAQVSPITPDKVVTPVLPVMEPAQKSERSSAQPPSLLNQPPLLVAAQSQPVTKAPTNEAAAQRTAPDQISRTVELVVSPQPFDAVSAFQRFLRHVEAGRLADARAENHAIEQALGEAHILTLKTAAYLAFEEGNMVQAQSKYQRILDKIPNDRESGINLMQIMEKQGHIDAGLRLSGQFLEKYPGDAQIRAIRERLARK